MPFELWKHHCPTSDTLIGMATPSCPRCGEPGEYDGWRQGSLAKMAIYQAVYGLKPIGKHRPLADQLFAGLLKRCSDCGGKGLRDVVADRSYYVCSTCLGAGVVLAGTHEDLERARQAVLSKHPNAAAPRVAPSEGAILLYDLERGIVIGAPPKNHGAGHP